MPDGIEGVLSQLRAALGGLLGNETIKSIVMWQVLGIVAQAALEPFADQLRQDLLSKNPVLPLSPAEAADAVVRGHLGPDQAFNYAGRSGLDHDVFQTLLDNAGEPLPLQSLLEAWRRSIIKQAGSGAGDTSLEQGIRESRLKNKWIPVIEALQWMILSPAEVVGAWVRNQIPEAEARERLRQAGVNTAEQTVMFHTAGRPPGPMELAELAHRGIIPWTGTGPDVLSVQQGIFEGDTKDKWVDVYQALTEYLPPPRTITAMIREGALTDEQGAALFKKAGMQPELIAAYLTAAHHQKTAAERELTKSEIVTAYKDQLVNKPTATKLLTTLNYTAPEIDFILGLADFQTARAEMASALSRLQTLYTRRKLTRAQTVAFMEQLNVPTGQQEQLLRTWELERAATIPELTSAEVVAAAYYGAISNAQALQQLEAQGWSPFDAWVLLSNRLHGPPTDIKQPAATIPEPYSG